MHGARLMADGTNPFHSPVPYPPPPFAAAIFYPFTLLSDHTAFLVQYWLLIALNMASIVLLAYCLLRSSYESVGSSALEIPILAVGTLLTMVCLSGQFHGYGLEFALERGNFDSYVLFASVAALACMIVWPGRVFMPIALLCFATHLKIYPAILLCLPLLQAWKRSIVPLVAINLSMLFTFGIREAEHFFWQIGRYMAQPYIWPGNHSIAAYVDQVVVPALTSPSRDPEAIRVWAVRFLTILVIGVWVHGMIRLRSVVPKAKRWLLMAALSFPVMGTLSSTSHDYKLVIYVVPVMVSAYYFAEDYLVTGSRWSMAAMLLPLACGIAIGHSTILPSWPLLMTKFPIVAFLELIVYGQTYLCREAVSLEPQIDRSEVPA